MGLEIYYEFKSLGSLVKVTAIEGTTGLEASVVCPQNLAPQSMRNLAMRKLFYVMKTKGSLNLKSENLGSDKK